MKIMDDTILGRNFEGRTKVIYDQKKVLWVI